MLDIEEYRKITEEKVRIDREYLHIKEVFKKRAKEICQICSMHNANIKYDKDRGYYKYGEYNYNKYDIVYTREEDGVIVITSRDLEEDIETLSIKTEDFISDDIIVRLNKEIPKLEDTKKEREEEKIRERELKELERLKAKYEQ